MEEDVGYVSTIFRSESFSLLMGVALLDDMIYASDYCNHCIWRIDPSSGNVSSYAGAAGKSGYQDGPTSTARFNSPWGLASSGSSLYVCDGGNHVVRMISDGAVSTTHALTDAQISRPCGIAVKDENVLLVSCIARHTISEIEVGKEVRTLAGIAKKGRSDGDCSKATFFGPHELAIGPDGSVYVADTGNRALRKIANDRVETVCKDLNGANYSVAVDDDENVYFSDSSRIYKLTRSGEREILCGSGEAESVDGQGEFASLDDPHGLCYDGESGCLYFTEKKAVRRVRVKPAKPFYDDELSRHLAKLINSSENGVPAGDAVFLVEGKRIEVAARILYIRSEYFNKMLSSTWKESSAGEWAPITIKEATYESFYAVITFLATGCLEVRKYRHIMPDILVLADRFLIKKLRDFCVKHLATRVSFRTALDYLSLADRHGFQVLRDACMQFVAKNVRAFCHDPKFADLGGQLLAELFRLVLK
ncbi:uncharacterized protein [Oscarella lobularis]|uniref:uncharacterized protein n=1 Tax=Oscarella lobularis TaxID=121494 RepID=UPI0033135CF7